MLKNAMTNRKNSDQVRNREAARVILEDPTSYGGPDSLSVRWARLVSERVEPVPKREAQSGPFERMELP